MNKGVCIVGGRVNYLCGLALWPGSQLYYKFTNTTDLLMKLNKPFLILKRDLRFTRLWSGVSVSVLGFTWMLYSINKESSLPIFFEETWEQGLKLSLWVFLALFSATPFVAIINYSLTARKRKVLINRDKLRENFVAEFASFNDLPMVAEFGRSLVGESHIDLETLERRHNINPQIVTCLYSANDPRKESLLGYYIMYPLTIDAYSDIQCINIINGRGIKDCHISKSFSDAAALYIGMAGGVGGHADGYVIEEMLEQISATLHSGHLKAVCTRGATPDGERVIRNFGFQKLAEPSEISCLYLNKSVLSGKRIKRHLAYR